MKIALLSEKYTPDIGGLAISTGRLGELFASAGHDVRVFCPSPNLPPSEKQILRSGGVRVTRFGAHKRVDDTLVDWFELITDEHQREPFDVIHAYFLPMAGFVGAYAGKYLDVPSVASIRGNDIERATFDPSKFAHVMYALQYADAVTTNASKLAKKAKAFVDREIHLIPNGIDTTLFKPMERNETLAESVLEAPLREQAPGVQMPVIGFVGELREKKGLATLLSGYAQLVKKTPASLLIVGEVRNGEDKKVFEEFRISNPEYRITVTGHVPHKDLPAYYSLMDVFVHPSMRDGMPNAVLEAMACGKAVIATPVGGMTDIIEDGVNGYLVKINDAAGLAEKMAEVLRQPEKREAVGRSAREAALSQFTLAKELQSNLTIYASLGVKQ
ncbi:MAG: glycosyltransferase family 4 protein [Anaerolineales bacterium]|nr:MAG: glycosyltransferase family 4 protein [Anaerolineales bacterium]